MRSVTPLATARATWLASRRPATAPGIGAARHAAAQPASHPGPAAPTGISRRRRRTGPPRRVGSPAAATDRRPGSAAPPRCSLGAGRARVEAPASTPLLARAFRGSPGDEPTASASQHAPHPVAQDLYGEVARRATETGVPPHPLRVALVDLLILVGVLVLVYRVSANHTTHHKPVPSRCPRRDGTARRALAPAFVQAAQTSKVPVALLMALNLREVRVGEQPGVGCGCSRHRQLLPAPQDSSPGPPTRSSPRPASAVDNIRLTARYLVESSTSWAEVSAWARRYFRAQPRSRSQDSPSRPSPTSTRSTSCAPVHRGAAPPLNRPPPWPTGYLAAAGERPCRLSY